MPPTCINTYHECRAWALLIHLQRIASQREKMGKVEDLRRKVAEAEAELQSLKADLAKAEKEAQEAPAQPWKWPLQPEEYERYGRQLIIPSVGVIGQPSCFSRIFKSSILNGSQVS